MTIPALDDPQWLQRFNNGSISVKSNIANGWLFALNAQLKPLANRFAVKQALYSVFSTQYRFIREVLPLVNPDMHQGEAFDGDVLRLIRRHVKTEATRQSVYAEAIHDLWLGKNEARVEAAAQVAKCISGMIADGLHVDLLDSLVTKLMWDVVAENPGEMLLRKHAAYISITAGSYGHQEFEHELPGHTTWFWLGKISSKVVADFQDVDGINLFDAVQQEPFAVSCGLIPSVMHYIRENGTDTHPYKKHAGLACAVKKDITEVTDYDILRAWIPAKKEFWDTAETLAIPYYQAAVTAVNEELKAPVQTIYLPGDIAVDPQNTPG